MYLTIFKRLMVSAQIIFLITQTAAAQSPYPIRVDFDICVCGMRAAWPTDKIAVIQQGVRDSLAVYLAKHLRFWEIKADSSESLFVLRYQVLEELRDEITLLLDFHLLDSELGNWDQVIFKPGETPSLAYGSPVEKAIAWFRDELIHNIIEEPSCSDEIQETLRRYIPIAARGKWLDPDPERGPRVVLPLLWDKYSILSESLFRLECAWIQRGSVANLSSIGRGNSFEYVSEDTTEIPFPALMVDVTHREYNDVVADADSISEDELRQLDIKNIYLVEELPRSLLSLDPSGSGGNNILTQTYYWINSKFGDVIEAASLIGSMPGSSDTARSSEYHQAIDPVDKKIREAFKLAAAGKILEAISSYKLALIDARTPEQRVMINHTLADLLGREAQYLKDPSQVISEAVTYYRNAIAEAVNPLKLRIRNDFALFLLETGHPESALEYLGQLEPEMRSSTSIDSSFKSSFEEDYGRALELVNRQTEALTHFYRAVKLDSTNDAALDSAFRLALMDEMGTVGNETAIRLIERLIQRKNGPAVERYLPSILGDADPTYHHRLLDALVRYFTFAEVAPDSFDQTWSKGLRSLHLDNPVLIGRRNFITAAYLEDLPLAYDQGQAMSYFAERWNEYSTPRSGINSEAVSAFLKMAGDEHYRAGNSAKALQRYALAWNIHSENIEAAVYLANLLLESSKEVDPDGRNLTLWIDNLFNEKNIAYVEGNLSDILRFHTLLGTIYERLGNWGNVQNPRSAVYQWEHALSIYERMADSGQADPRIAAKLHTKIATTYQMLGREPEAGREFYKILENQVRLSQYGAAHATFTVLDYQRPYVHLNQTERGQLDNWRTQMSQVLPDMLDMQVTVSVKDPTNRPLSDVIVTLEGPTGIYTSITDGSGSATFRYVRPGIYTATFFKRNFRVAVEHRLQFKHSSDNQVSITMTAIDR